MGTVFCIPNQWQAFLVIFHVETDLELWTISQYFSVSFKKSKLPLNIFQTSRVSMPYF